MQNFNFEMHYLVRNLYINFSIYIVCITYLNILFTKKDRKYNFFFWEGGALLFMSKSNSPTLCQVHLYIEKQ